MDKTKGLGLVLVDDEEETASSDHEEQNKEVVILVYEFANLSDGSTGPAEACGRISEGDVLLEVEGQAVKGLSYEEVIELIQDAPEVIRLRFRPSLALYPSDNESDGEEGTQKAAVAGCVGLDELGKGGVAAQVEPTKDPRAQDKFVAKTRVGSTIASSSDEAFRQSSTSGMSVGLDAIEVRVILYTATTHTTGRFV